MKCIFTFRVIHVYQTQQRHATWYSLTREGFPLLKLVSLLLKINWISIGFFFSSLICFLYCPSIYFSSYLCVSVFDLRHFTDFIALGVTNATKGKCEKRKMDVNLIHCNQFTWIRIFFFHSFAILSLFHCWMFYVFDSIEMNLTKSQIRW